MSMPPEGALTLSTLGSPFVIDGERLTGDLAGYFVAFDLLELGHEDFTTYSYALRITTLHEAMRDAGLLHEDRFTPTFAEAQANSKEALLALLAPAPERARAQHILEEVQAASGEGVVARRLLSDYAESPRKFKLVADLDAFVIAINAGIAEGSLKMGVLRPTDGAIIEVANVRSGLTDVDIRTVRQMLERGERPVFTVTYLPKRTVGIQLVEPRTSMTRLRSDKSAAECTTDQFDAEKAPFIAQAKPFAGVVLS
jgi:ATP-dependent DNA ligase